MSQENLYNQNCVLCYSYLSDWNTVQESPEITPSIISGCLKHIPQDISQTVNWDQPGENNCLRFCRQCDYNIRTLSQLNSDLEEIQRKINELVNCITFHVSKEREINTTHFVSQSKLVSLLGNFPVNALELQKEQYEVRILPIPKETELKDNEDIDNDVESIDSDYNGGTTLVDRSTTATIVKKTNSAEGTKVSTDSSLNSTIQCKEQTNPKSSLQKLLESTSGYECSTCHKRFSRYNILQKHDCGKSTVECDACGLSFSSSGVLKLHTRTHTGERPYKCETCGEAFSIKANLRTHIMAKHSQEKTFECKICSKKFSYAVALSKHNLSHKNETLLKCDVCSESFKTLKRLKFHLVTHSTETPHPYKCDLCDKTFATPEYANKHKKKVHFAEKQYQCDVCGKSFAVKDSLLRHQMIHSGEKPFQCSHCGKNYRTSSELKSHEWTHKDEGQIQCELCGKSYKNSHSLKIHLISHKTKRIPCEICGKTFMGSGLKTHIKSVHRKERPFKCDICGKGFGEKKSQVAHVNRFCHICNTFFRRDDNAADLLRHQNEVHTVMTTLYSNLASDSTGDNRKRKVFPSRKATREGNYGESSSESEEMSCDSSDDEDAANDLNFKVEVKPEEGYSEGEDSDS